MAGENQATHRRSIADRETFWAGQAAGEISS